MTMQEAAQAQVSINSKIPSYTEKGEKIKTKDWGSYVTDENYSHDIYVDENGTIKAIVFVKKDISSTEKATAPPIVSLEGKAAPDRLLSDMNGNNFTLASLKGKIVVLNFWFTTCKPCIVEMPELNEVKDNFKGKDVVFLAVTFDKKQPVESFLKTHTFNYTIIPEAREFLDLWNANIFPSNIVIDKDGVVRFHQFGYSENLKKTLSDNINSLL